MRKAILLSVLKPTIVLLGLIGSVFAAGVAAPAPVCQFEDGNPNGQPCLWSDPDTGNAYYVTSEDYR